MNFLLSGDQLGFVDAVRRVLCDKCSSLAVHRQIDSERPFDEELWSQMCALGVPAIAIEESFGGLGLQLIDLAIVAELLGEFTAPVPFFGHAVAALAIQLAGSPEQKTRWLPLLASGELLATVAFAEARAHWLPTDWQLAGDVPLTGVKYLVPAAAEAALLVVGTTEGLAVVERGNGYHCEPLDDVDRTRRMSSVSFNGAIAHKLPGNSTAIDRVIDAAAVLLAADAFGGARRVTELTVDYAKLREQYGRPIGEFQAVKHQLANMALAVEPSRGLFWFAAYAWDALPEQSRYAAAQAKAHCTEVFLQAARDMVELHGGIGFTWEHEAHVYLKRAMFDWAWLGQPDRHRLRAADIAGW